MRELPRLKSLDMVRGDARLPDYTPKNHDIGIVHLGVGAFQRAHIAAYTDTALSENGGHWRICGVNFRSSTIADQLNPQNGFYTLVERGGSSVAGRVIGSVRSVITRQDGNRQILNVLTSVGTKTVTEKAYGIDRNSRLISPTHPAVALDLSEPRTPTSVLGVITESLRIRRANYSAPFTVLCCDNLPDNGAFLKSSVCDFARKIDPNLAAWIQEEVAFPSSMVDRPSPPWI